jgi:hypothetical protein
MKCRCRKARTRDCGASGGRHHAKEVRIVRLVEPDAPEDAAEERGHGRPGAAGGRIQVELHDQVTDAADGSGGGERLEDGSLGAFAVELHEVDVAGWQVT